MNFNEDRVKLFATILRMLTNPEVIKQLADKGEEFDFENLVRAIATMVPYPERAFQPFSIPAAPAGSIPYVLPPTIPNTVPDPGWTPYRPLIGDPPGWNPSNPTVICSGTNEASSSARPFLSAMTQADGQGDDSGTRGD